MTLEGLKKISQSSLSGLKKIANPYSWNHGYQGSPQRASGFSGAAQNNPIQQTTSISRPSFYDRFNAFKDTYKKTDGFFWHPSKSNEDNLRGYAETGGEMVGGFGGALLGALGGSVAAGPPGMLGGAALGGYTAGKAGKGAGRNLFNYAWPGNTGQGIDSLGRSKGQGFSNDFSPKLHDLGYAIPLAGGALNSYVKL